MALYDLNSEQVKFLGTMVTNVLPQGKREEIRAFIDLGDKVLESFRHPIHPTGKPINIPSKIEEDIRGLSPQELKVVNESK